MFNAIDSSSGKPTAALVAQFRAAGYRNWSGYLGTRPNVGLWSPWSEQHFAIAQGMGTPPIAYVSGWDDPVALRAMGAARRVRPCLDNEGGIRPDGPWVQPFLDLLQGGHYGPDWVHRGRRAAFDILGGYPGNDPGATWSGPRPANPCGWQWRGTVSMGGINVDLTHLDDWFLTPIGGSPVQLSQSFKLAFARILFILLRGGEPTVEAYNWWAAQIKDDGSNLDAIAASMLDSPEGVAHLIAVARAVQLAADPNTTVALADALAAKAEIDALTVRLTANDAVDTAAATDIAVLQASVVTLTATVAGLVDTPSGVDLAKVQKAVDQAVSRALTAAAAGAGAA